MNGTAGSPRPRSDLQWYEVCLQGHLDSRWADRLHGMTFTYESEGMTTLRGQLTDQAALHGLLNQVRDLGLPIVSIRRINPGQEPTTT